MRFAPQRLLLSTDGLHINTVAAGMIADLVERWLLSEPI